MCSFYTASLRLFSDLAVGDARLGRQDQLCYVGFSQGSAQAFAALSSNPDLLKKVYLFVALSPAVRANHLAQSLLLSLVQANLRFEFYDLLRVTCRIEFGENIWSHCRVAALIPVLSRSVWRCNKFQLPDLWSIAVIFGSGIISFQLRTGSLEVRHT